MKNIRRQQDKLCLPTFIVRQGSTGVHDDRLYLNVPRMNVNKTAHFKKPVFILSLSRVIYLRRIPTSPEIPRDSCIVHDNDKRNVMYKSYKYRRNTPCGGGVGEGVQLPTFLTWALDGYARCDRFTPQEKAAVRIVQVVGCELEPVWTGVEKIKSLISPTLKPRTLRPELSRPVNHTKRTGLNYERLLDHLTTDF